MERWVDIEDGEMGDFFFRNRGIWLVLGEGIRQLLQGGMEVLCVGEGGKRLQTETNSQQMLIFISDLSKNAPCSYSSSSLHWRNVVRIIKQIWGSVVLQPSVACGGSHYGHRREGGTFVSSRWASWGRASSWVLIIEKWKATLNNHDKGMSRPTVSPWIKAHLLEWQ